MPPSRADFALILAPNPGPMTLSGTNTYVAGRDPGYVVDPGPDLPDHLEAVRREGDARGGLAGAVLTHSHADHSAGVATLGAPLLWGRVSESDETAALAAAAAGSEPPTGEPERPETAAGDPGFAVEPLSVLPTPGHSRDHVAFVFGEVCFCGDLVLGEGSTIVPPAAYGGSLADYMDSLRRLRTLDAALLAPGHGPLIEDPGAKLDAYIAHREAREDRLVEALERGERSRSRLLDIAWDDVPEILRPAAAMAMQAHMEKLEAEGRLAPAELRA